MPFQEDRLAWAQLAQREREASQQAWEHSPEFLDQTLRTRQNVQNVQAGLEQSDPSGTFARQRAQEIALRQAPAQEAGRQARETLKLKAQLDAKDFEMRYTEKDKAEVSKLNRQKNQGFALYQQGKITQDEYIAHNKQIDGELMGIVPGVYKTLSPYPKGQGVGDVWQESGLWRTRDSKGETHEVDWKKTEAGMAQEHEVKATLKRAELEAQRQKGRENLAIKMMEATDYDKETKKERSLYSPADIRERLEKVYPSTPAASPAEVQHAQEFIDTMEARWGSKPPPDVVGAMKRAGDVIKSANDRIF